MIPEATRFQVEFEIGEKVLSYVWYVRHEDTYLPHLEVEQVYYRQVTKALQEAVGAETK